MPSQLIETAVTLLRQAQVPLAAGLSGSELAAVESRFGFTFCPDHAALLAECLPEGKSWPDWREGSEEDLRARLDWPVEGALFDVSKNSFWPASWGEKRSDADEATRTAKAELLQWPTMVPLYGHRYLAAGPVGGPVFSIYQTDVIYYGSDLADCFRREFGSFGQARAIVDPHPIWPWSDLSAGAEDRDL